MKEAQKALVEAMLDVVRGWREFFVQQVVEARSIDMLEQAMLPPSFFRDTPPEAV
jgi:serine/threonine-protein kinase HipA